MKKTVFATLLVLALTLMAAAQRKLAPSQHGPGSLARVEAAVPTTPPQPPSLCSPCVFYGGDLNISDPNAAGFSNENTLLIPGSTTYAAFEIPSGHTASITGVLVNVQSDVNFDPKTASYDIRTGVSEGNGGTSIASGTANIAVASTGRNFFGLNEYTVRVHFAPMALSPGEYWVNVLPGCTNGAKDGSCNVGRIFLSNTTQETNGFNAQIQPGGSMFFNSPFFGFTWANWCDASLGLNAQQCNAASFGLTGTFK